jgi:2-polyprenyl-3-methyl-5-hydroxy-6-metoxy-1,4-benzoquinol methylase
MWRRTYRHIVEGYLEHRFGYIFPGRRTFAAHMWPLLYAFPLRRQREERNVMWLPSRKDQLLLDVGCGSGAFMRRMGNLGWRVEGVDFDPGAVAFAQSCGCKALCGSVEDMCYPSNHFDVVVMNHVIEHLSDPISSLKECFRILRPGGKIAVATPNVQSLGHKCFGRSWRGLEPPRHLYLFGFCSLDRLLLAAGFDDRHIYSYVALSVLEASLCLKFKFMAPRSNGAIRQLIQLCALLLSLAEYFVGHFRPYMGECLAAQAVKPR